MSKIIYKLISAVIIAGMLIQSFTFSIFAGETPVELLNCDMTIMDGKTQYYSGALAESYENKIKSVGSWLMSYKTVKGAFGKSEDDVSGWSYVNNLSERHRTWFTIDSIVNHEFSAGDVLNFRFKVAYEIIRDAAPKLQFESDVYTNANILSFTKDGTLYFAGKKFSQFHLNRSKWYDYNLVFKIGDDASGQKCTASLYVDGIAYGEDIVLANKQINKIKNFTFWFNGNYVEVGESYSSYFDDITATVYRDESEIIKKINLESGIENLNYDGNVLVLDDDSFTAEEVVDSITGNISEIEYLDMNYNVIDSGSMAENGYIKTTLADGNVIFTNIFVNGSVVSIEDFSDSDYTGNITGVIADKEKQSVSLKNSVGIKTSDDSALCLEFKNVPSGTDESSLSYLSYPVKYSTNLPSVFEAFVYRDNADTGIKITLKTSDGTIPLCEIDGRESVSQWSKINIILDRGAGVYAVCVNGEEIASGSFSPGVFMNTINIIPTLKTDIAAEEISAVFAVDDISYAYTSYDSSGDQIKIEASSDKLFTDAGQIILGKDIVTVSDVTGNLNILSGSIKVYSDRNMTDELDGSDPVSEGNILVNISDNEKVCYAYEIIKERIEKFSVVFNGKKLYINGKISDKAGETVNWTLIYSDYEEEILNGQFVTGTDGFSSFTAELEDVPKGNYALRLQLNSEKKETGFIIYDFSVLEEVLEKYSSCTNKTEVSDLIKNHADIFASENIADEELEFVSAKLIKWKSYKDYVNAETIVDVFYALRGIYALTENDDADEMFTFYAPFLKTDISEFDEFDRTLVNEVLSGLEFENPDFDSVFEKAKLFIRLKSIASWAELKNYFIENYKLYDADISVYNELKSSQKGEVFMELFSKLEDYENSDEFSSDFENLSKKYEKENNKSSSSGGGGGSSKKGSSQKIVADTNIMIAEPISPESGNDNPDSKVTVLSDIENHFSKDAVLNLMEKGIINGYDDNTFRPDMPVTRAEFSKLIAVAFGIEKGSGNTYFDDVSKNDWYFDYVELLSSNGIIKGDGKNFMPENQIKRQDAAVILARLLGISANGEYELFVDDAITDEYARDAVYALKSEKLVSGDENGKFNPSDVLTRGEAAVIIYNAMNFKR